jgi:hypothetical protein
MRGVLLRVLAGCLGRCLNLVSGLGSGLWPALGVLGITGCLSGSELGSGRSCHRDDVCDSGEVCARDSVCYLSSQVHAVHVTWTVNGEAAGVATCSRSPNLVIEFVADDSDPIGGQLSFSPVPCSAGLYTNDKLPTKFHTVKLNGSRGWQSAEFDSGGDAAIDLSVD